MADGRDDRVNRPPGRGSKLRHQGSNPTGTQTRSFKAGPYTDELDYQTGSTQLNQNIRASDSNHQENIRTSAKCRKRGCLFREPLP